MGLWKKFGIYFFISVLCFSCSSGVFASSYDDLAKDRIVTLWVEGQVLGEMVIGARSQLVFVYMDRKACDAARSERGKLPDWLTWNLQYEAVAAKEKKALFLIRYRTLKNWDFIISQLSVGGYVLSEKDILTRSDFTQLGPIPSDTEGTLAIAVPLSKLKPGNTISIAYGEWYQKWTIPKR